MSMNAESSDWSLRKYTKGFEFVCLFFFLFVRIIGFLVLTGGEKKIASPTCWARGLLGFLVFFFILDLFKWMSVLLFSIYLLKTNILFPSFFVFANDFHPSFFNILETFAPFSSIWNECKWEKMLNSRISNNTLLLVIFWSKKETCEGFLGIRQKMKSKETCCIT